MPSKVDWQDLQLFDRDNDDITDEVDRFRYLAEFRTTGSIDGVFFHRLDLPHEDPDDASTWGPASPGDVDWTDFPPPQALLVTYQGTGNPSFSIIDAADIGVDVLAAEHGEDSRGTPGGWVLVHATAAAAAEYAAIIGGTVEVAPDDDYPSADGYTYIVRDGKLLQGTDVPHDQEG